MFFNSIIFSLLMDYASPFAVNGVRLFRRTVSALATPSAKGFSQPHHGAAALFGRHECFLLRCTAEKITDDKYQYSVFRQDCQ